MDKSNFIASCKDRKALLGCWILGIFVVVAASWDGLTSPSSAEYSATNAMTAMTVIGLIVYNYWTWRMVVSSIQIARDQEEQRNHENITLRKTLATACLAELAGLAGRTEKIVKDLSENEIATLTPAWISESMISLASQKIWVFDIQTASHLATAKRYIEDLSMFVALKRDAFTIRARAKYCYNQIQILAKSLQLQGGTMPENEGQEITGSDVQILTSNCFDIKAQL